MAKPDPAGERRRLRRAAAILLACHLAELVVTVWLSVQMALTSQQRRHLLALLVILLVAQLLVAAASLIWVHQQLRFEDRWAGRLLCYLLHALGCALLWRAGKLLIAFDARDVRELATLRHLLVHAQTIPVCLLHMYISYLSGSLGLFPAAPVVVLLGSGVATVVLASSVFSAAGGGAGGASGGSALSLPTLPEPADSPLAVPRGAAADWTGADDAWSRLLVAVQALCLLWARLTALATFGSVWLSWAAGVVAAHWTVAAVWLAAQQYLLEEQRSLAARAGRVTFLAYLLVFDWQVNRDSGSALTVCARPRAAACYYVLIGLENSVLLGLWVAFSEHIPHTKLATVTGAAATFSVGAVILVMLYCYSAETALGRGDDGVLEVRVVEGGPVRTGNDGVMVTQAKNHSYVDYKIDDEVLSERRRRGMGVSLPAAGAGNLYTAFPVMSRSDRSTDNHSSNSRNTNTLCDPEPVSAEPLVLMPCSATSDCTISSMSRPPCYTSTPRRAPWETSSRCHRRKSAPPSHVCDAGLRCHCRLFDQRPRLHLLEPVHPSGCHAAVGGRPFRILCAGCLVPHDPLLTTCGRLARRPSCVGAAAAPPTAHVHSVSAAKSTASTADYPSDSVGSERRSVSCSDSERSTVGDDGASSCSSYTTWPPRSAQSASMAPLSWLLPPDLSGPEYVQAWLELCGQKSEPPAGRPAPRKKKLCRRQHAGCPQVHVRAARGPPTVAAPVAARTGPSRKQQLKKALRYGKLLRRGVRDPRARSASPRPCAQYNASGAATPAPPVAKLRSNTIAAPRVTRHERLVNKEPEFVQNVEAYL